MGLPNNIFERFLFEAPGDDPPPDDTSAAPDVDSSPSDIPADDDAPPDIGGDDDLGSDDVGGDDEAPPDLGGEDDAGFGEDDSGYGDKVGGEEDQNNPQNLELDEKISAIMNMNLYQRYLALLNNISNQIVMIKDNNDILYILSADSLDIESSLKKLDENIHLYLKNNFMNENYSKNLLFFNKCLNLLKLLNDTFNSKIQKGIKVVNK